MTNNLMKRISLLESTKDELIKKLMVARYDRHCIASELWKYENRFIYEFVDKERCLNKIEELKSTYDIRKRRVYELTKQLKTLEFELIMLYDEYNAFDILGFCGPEHTYSAIKGAARDKNMSYYDN